MSNIIDLDQIADANVKVKIQGEIVEVRSPGLVELAEMMEHFNKLEGDNADLGAMKKATNIILDWVVEEGQRPLFRRLTIKQFQKLVETIVKEVSGGADLPAELTPSGSSEGQDGAKKKSD